MAISQNFPIVDPTLRLNFQGARTLDPRITFERSSIGTYVDEDGLIKTAAADQARFDHDSSTGESLGLLIEESRSNIALYSQEFDNVYWNKTGGGNPGTTVTANQAVSPDGTVTADFIDYTTAITNSKLVERQFDNTPAGKTYTGSVWIKGTAGQTINLLLDGYGVDVPGEQYTLDGTWQRLTITRSYSADFSAAALFRFGVRPLGASAGTANQVYAWGAQIEQGSFPTSYIPTSGSTVTRSADSASITGSNFSSWYNSTAGTLFATARRTSIAANNDIINIGDGTGNNRITLYSNTSGAAGWYSNISGSNQLNTTISNQFPALTEVDVAGVYSLNDCQVCANGVLGVADTSFSIPSVNKLDIGSTISGYYLNGHLKQLLYYPERLTNEQLQNLTK